VIESRHFALHRLVNLHPGTLGELAELAIRQGWEIEVLEEELEALRNRLNEPQGLRFGRESLKAYLERVELEAVRQALRRTDGVTREAAALLGVPRTTLQYKMQRLEWRRNDAGDVDPGGGPGGTTTSERGGGDGGVERSGA
jgi:DNA-binding NtrC family response regulator